VRPSFKLIKKILFLLGVGAFFYLVWKLGWQQLLKSLIHIGWWWVPIILLSVTWQFCHSMAWHQIIRSQGYNPSPFRLLKLKFVSEAINMIAPSANVGGDMVRAYLIKNEIPLTTAISSVMVDKTIDNFNRMFFNIAGLMVTAFFIPIPQTWIWACIGLVSLIFIFNSLLVLVQVKGFAKSVKKIARFIPPLRRALEKREEKLDALAEELHRIYLKSPARILAASGWHFMGRLLGLVEIWLVLRLLLAPVSFAGAYYIAAIANMINSAFFLVPGQWGVAEGAQALILKTLGYTAAAGLSLGIIRRIRRLFLTGAGLLIFALYKKEKNEPLFEKSVFQK